MRKFIRLRCSNCNRIFKRKRGKFGILFCSRYCYNDFCENYIGLPNVEKRKEIRSNVWKRDNSICRLCGEEYKSNNVKRFHIHHMIPSIVERYRYNINNLILLCITCHRWTHSKKNKDKIFIVEYRVR